MSAPWTWRVEQTLPSENDAHRPFVEALLVQLAEHAFASTEIFGVRMAVEEAMVNAIKHGNGLEPCKKVRVLCELNHECVRIEIEDEGPGFDPAQVPDPTDEANWEFPCGRGLMLMRNFMSKVEYNSAGNRVVMERQKKSAE